MNIIVCDSDFIIKLANDPIPALDWSKVSRENQFVTIAPVLRELKGLTKNRLKSKTARRARAAVNLVEKFQLIRAVTSGEGEGEHPRSTKEETDTMLIEFVRTLPKDRMLATMDGSLLSRAERLGLPYMTLSRGRPLFHRGREQRI